jgi:hypothetical protein
MVLKPPSKLLSTVHLRNFTKQTGNWVGVGQAGTVLGFPKTFSPACLTPYYLNCQISVSAPSISACEIHSQAIDCSLFTPPITKVKDKGCKTPETRFLAKTGFQTPALRLCAFA